MSRSPEQHESDQAKRLGKVRTWWHPLLTRLLSHELSTAYSVQEEVPVGILPQRVDILLIRREAGELSEASRRDLESLLPLLSRITLIEFKAPTDSLRPGDVALLFGYAFSWHGQQTERVPKDDISLIILAPSANEPLRDELRALGWEAGEHEPGIFRVAGAPFATWVVETDVMAERGQPILSLVSRVFLREHERIMQKLLVGGHAPLLYYFLQQVQQFRKWGKEFEMQHTETELLGQVEEELQAAVLQDIPVAKRLQGITAEEILQTIPVEKRLQGITAEEILQTIPVEKLLQRLTAEQLAAGLGEEQVARLRELLERKEGH